MVVIVLKRGRFWAEESWREFVLDVLGLRSLLDIQVGLGLGKRVNEAEGTVTLEIHISGPSTYR